MNKFLEKVKTKVNIKIIKEVAKQYLFWLGILCVLQLVLIGTNISSKVSLFVFIIGLSIYLLYLFFKAYIKIREKIGLYADLNHKMKNAILDFNILTFACIFVGIGLKVEEPYFRSGKVTAETVNLILSIAWIIITGILIYIYYSFAKEVYDLYEEAKSRHSQKHYNTNGVKY